METIKDYLESIGIDTSRVIRADENSMVAVKHLDEHTVTIGKYRKEKINDFKID